MFYLVILISLLWAGESLGRIGLVRILGITEMRICGPRPSSVIEVGLILISVVVYGMAASTSSCHQHQRH